MNRSSQAASTLLVVLLVLLLALISAHAHSSSNTFLITAVYYDTYLSGEPEEAFRLMNISGSTVDLTGWEVTDYTAREPTCSACYPGVCIPPPPPDLTAPKCLFAVSRLRAAIRTALTATVMASVVRYATRGRGEEHEPAGNVSLPL